MNVKTSEIDRAHALRREFHRSGMTLEDLLLPPYEAIVIHSQSTIVVANQAAAALVGCEPETLTGMNAWALFPAASLPLVRAKLAAHATMPYRVIARRLNGEQFLIEIRGTEFGLNGEPVRAVMLREVETGAAPGVRILNGIACGESGS